MELRQEPDKRKYKRFCYRQPVELHSAEERSFPGTSINMSSGGMQILVDIPVSHESIKRLSFQIPGHPDRFELLCRAIPSFHFDDQGRQLLGVEFLSASSEQLLLIDKFIQDRFLGGDDARELPRTSCHIEDVKAEGSAIQIISIDNISTAGVLLTYRGHVSPADALSLSVGIPGAQARLTLSGSVVYVLANFDGTFIAGLRFFPMKETEEAILRNLVVSCFSGNAMRGLHDHLDARHSDAGSDSRIIDEKSIASLLESVRLERIRLSTILDSSFTILEHAIQSVRTHPGQFSIKPLAQYVPRVEPGQPAYFAFSWNKASHYFRSDIVLASSDAVVLSFPGVVYRSDKRSYARKHLRGTAVKLKVPSDEAGSHEYEGQLLDVSRRGFLCELTVPFENEALFSEGSSVSYEADERLGLGQGGQIRHLKKLRTQNRVLLQLGVETEIGPGAPECRRISETEWEILKSTSRIVPSAPLKSGVVHFCDQERHEICALLNRTDPNLREGPVVVIPSPYGRKKEAFAPLVATLISSFSAAAKPLITLRYDGVNRPGESYQELSQCKPGYEMLSYRTSQGQSDLAAAVDFVQHNSLFSPKKVIVVSFSMSAVDVRRYISEHPGRIDLWISCMGVPAAQTTLRSILGGIDVIANWKLGLPNGIVGLLGHLVDMDIMASDIVDARYAFMPDARLDMSRISVPVVWICGRHDKWVDIDEVVGLMSVASGAGRTLVEIPVGHNLRTSEDAIQTFQIVASSIHENIHGEPVPFCQPSKEDILRLVTWERERLERRANPPLSEYWHDYLMGNERNAAGYDFYQTVPEFSDFMKAQIECLSLGEGEIVADVGCGTGIFSEELLRHVAHAKGNGGSVEEFFAIDLVEDALEKTKQKCMALVGTEPSLAGIDFAFLKKDLEPNRLVPVLRFIESGAESFESLKGRIDGLSSRILDRLAESGDPEISKIALGAVPPPQTAARLASRLGSVELEALLELGRASRFLNGKLRESDFRSRERKHPSKDICTSDLIFHVLYFGDSGLPLGYQLPQRHFTKIVASLFLSYLRNPDYALSELYSMLRPGGTIVVSSMRPDSDLSTIFTNYIRRIENQNDNHGGAYGTGGARAMLNEAATLFELEEDGYFRFYTSRELKELLEGAGFADISLRSSMGTPPQAVIAAAKRPRESTS
jgi:ubiquinone/menaquinone biosynthesis C-methylase UbiE/pimeloyl-ACP methyl ester carboxylesterase